MKKTEEYKKLYRKQYYAANKEKMNLINKAYYQKHKNNKKFKLKRKLYYKINKEKISQYQSKYRLNKRLKKAEEKQQQILDTAPSFFKLFDKVFNFFDKFKTIGFSMGIFRP